MRRGTLEVQLGNAKGLEDTDFLQKMDPYVIVTCRTQEKKSSVASGQGSCPEWNETLLFTISGNDEEITMKIMDKDTGTSDDFVGQAKIPLMPCFETGNCPMKAYSVAKNGKIHGEIRVGLAFFPEEARDRGFSMEEENFGGWKQSSMP